VTHDVKGRLLVTSFPWQSTPIAVEAHVSLVMVQFPPVPLSVLIAAITFFVTWYARKLPGRVPPVITGITVGTGLYYLLQAVGLGALLGPVIGSEHVAGTGLSAFPYFADLARVADLRAIVPTIVAGALALAIVASMDALRRRDACATA
jgi:MFS superfamily sulfate permease-like transporter